MSKQNEQPTNPTTDAKTSVDISVNEDTLAAVASMLNGVYVGAASVLAINGNNTELEVKVINYLKSYTASVVQQGLTKEALGFLWNQMGIAAEMNRENTVQNVAHYLLGCVLEKFNEPKAVK